MRRRIKKILGFENDKNALMTTRKKYAGKLHTGCVELAQYKNLWLELAYVMSIHIGYEDFSLGIRLVVGIGTGCA